MIGLSSRLPAGVAAALLVVLAGVGCQSSPEDQVKEAFRNAFRENGKRVATMYARFMASPTRPVRGRDDFAGPADEAQLRAFIAAMPEEALLEMGITNPDSQELFKSERDGMPFRVRYGVKGPLSTTYAIVCEAQGVNGRLKVFKSDGSSTEVAADEADEYMTGKRDVAYAPGSSL